MEIVYRLADVPVRAVFQHAYMTQMCQGYETDEPAELTSEVTAEDIALEREKSEAPDAYTDAYLETLAFYRKFVTAVSDRDILLFHGSAVSFDGGAYIFTAPSGTGKSTHTNLCAALYKERFFYINDDKPLLRLIDGCWYVYGTPWDGKHRLSTNTRAPLKGICFLERGPSNHIVRAGSAEMFPRLLGQTFRPSEPTSLAKVLSLSMILSRTPLWKLSCTISREAAELSLPTMARVSL